MWLCVAAVPVQGWAAAAMLNCGPGHHRIASAVQSAVHAFHRHVEANVEPVSQNPAQDADRHDESASKPSGLDRGVAHADFDTVSKFKCSACAACCSSAALPTAALPLDVSAPVEFAAPIRPSSDVLFLTCGTDRPPRPDLA